MGITNRIFSIGIYILIRFSKGYQPIAGYNFGSKNTESLKSATKISIKWSTIFAIVLLLPIFLNLNGVIVSQPLADLFTTRKKSKL